MDSATGNTIKCDIFKSDKNINKSNLYIFIEDIQEILKRSKNPEDMFLFTDSS